MVSIGGLHSFDYPTWRLFSYFFSVQATIKFEAYLLGCEKLPTSHELGDKGDGERGSQRSP